MTKTVGFVGVGNMGWPMAACLVKAGFTVNVNDSRLDTANSFVQQIGGFAPELVAPIGREIRHDRHHAADQRDRRASAVRR